jgi:GNAT superfamily N-acetyltransferase
LGLSRPEQLAADHDLSSFHSGDDAIDDWLQRRARKNQESGASKVMVVCDEHKHVVAFYTLSASGIVRIHARGKSSRGMPDPIPVLLLGQLGVHQHYQRQGLASHLVRDALLRAATVADRVDIVGVYVDAMTPALIPFYERFGFDSISPAEPSRMMIRMKDVRAVLAGR